MAKVQVQAQAPRRHDWKFVAGPVSTATGTTPLVVAVCGNCG